ncbi:MAG TPA: hypothetical protein VH374_13355 [Polyangia bacterium]|nr:hypothetical protein [Polyangia bacterium]
MKPAGTIAALLLLCFGGLSTGCQDARAQMPSARGDKPADSAPPPATAKNAAGSLTDAVRDAAAGSPVLLVLSDNAVEARSADGKFKRVIVPGPVQQAIYDPALDLLWVRRLNSIEVWDLRQPKPKAVPVIAAVSEEGEFTVEMKGNRSLRLPSACVVSGTTQLKWVKPPSVGLLGFDEGEPPKPRLVGGPWLNAQFERTARPLTITRADLPAFGTKPVVDLPASVGKCDEPGQCGTAVPFGATGWNLVYAGESPGEDCRHFRCLLHDPATGKFGKPPLPARWLPAAKGAAIGECGLYRFDSSGKWFAIGGKLCTAGGTCADLGDATPLGWIDGERDIGTTG